MVKFIKEYNSWLKENKNFILHLQSHDASIYTRIMPIYEVLNFLSVEYTENGLEMNEDLWKIFQIWIMLLRLLKI